MLRLTFFVILKFFLLENVLASENIKNFSCEWDNDNQIPCVEIKKEISNTSQFSKSGINKIVISRKQIDDIGAVDLNDVFKSIPDINLTRSGPMGQQASLFMRGSGSNHTLVMINGVPINDQSTTQGLHDFGVDFVQTIQQIEIFPGSSGTHFGTNAIGGAINIILTGDYKNSYYLSSDKNANYEFFGNKTFNNNDSSLNFKFGTVKNKLISARGNKKDEKDGVENYSTNINYEKYLNNNSRLYNTIYLRQTIADYDNSNSNQTGYEGNNKMASYQIGVEKKEQNNQSNFVFYYNIYDREYDERGIIDIYESNVFGLKYDYSKIINNNVSIGFGTDYKYDWGYFNNNGSYNATTKGNSDNLAVYGNLGWNILKDTNLSIFGRNDHHKQTKSNNTFKINLNQNFKKLNFGVSYMNGLRNPTLYEMFGTDNFGYSGNKDLNPEKSNTYEIYSNLNFNKSLNLKIRAFRSNIKNNIEYISNKYQNDNDDVDLNQSGMNSQINYNYDNLNLTLYSSFLSSKKENSSDQLRRPEKNYGAIFSKNIYTRYIGDINLDLVYNHYGKHFDTHSTSFSTIEMDSTDLMDLKLSKNGMFGNYFLKISNLMNENFQRPHGYNQEERRINIGFKQSY